LHPVDVAVALALVEAPNATFHQVGSLLGISASTAHGAVERLRQAGLVRSGTLEIARPALLEFLEHGVRYAFPAVTHASARGVPTAHAGPPLAAVIAADEPLVWPSDRGSVTGPTVTPLFDRAPELPSRCPRVYALLTLVDALRVGRLRERRAAMELLRNQFYPSAVAASAAG